MQVPLQDLNIRSYIAETPDKCTHNGSILQSVLLGKLASLFHGKGIHTIYLFQNLNYMTKRNLKKTETFGEPFGDEKEFCC